MKRTILLYILSFILSTITINSYAQETIPYSFDFSDEEIFNRDWTILDLNEGSSWGLNDQQEVVYKFDKSLPGDDWLFTPGLQLTKGKAYKLSFLIKTERPYRMEKEKLKVTIGNEKTPEVQTIELFKDENCIISYYATKEASFSVSESGIWYIGFYCYSGAWEGNLYIKQIDITTEATYPAPINDLKVTAGENGALTANLSWTNPSTNNMGGELSSLSGTKIYRDGALIETLLNTSIGNPVEWTDNNQIEQPGKYVYKVVPFNEDGDALGTPKNVTSPWIGEDTPNAVTDLIATADMQTVSVDFTPPTKGKNDGWVNTQELSYKILRNPGNVTLEEAYKGNIPYMDTVNELASYTYTVIPYNQVGQGNSTISNKVVAGTAKDIPYSESFDTSESFDLFTSIDGKGDRNWSYASTEKAAQYWGGTSPIDMWLITPRLNLQTNKNYKLTFYTRIANARYAENTKILKITLGQGATIESQNQILKDEIIVDYAIYEKQEIRFFVKEDGFWNIGFNCFGDTNYETIYIDDISVEEEELTPEKVSDLTVLPEENGVLAATISWKNSALSAAGSPINFLSKVELYRGTELLNTFDNPELGAEESYIDTELPEAGKYTYKVISYIGDKAGEEATVSSPWIGADVPGAITDLNITVEGENVTINFTPPVTGENDGWIDLTSLNYLIVRNPGEVILEEAYKGALPYIDNIEELNGYTYTITPCSSAGTGSPTTSERIVAGGGKNIPFNEDFEQKENTEFFTIIDGNEDNYKWHWTDWPKSVSPKMEYYGGDSADEWLITPNLKLKANQKYKLSFLTKLDFATSPDYTRTLKVTIGEGNTADEQNHILMSDIKVDYALYRTQEVIFQVDKDGYWNIGINCYQETSSSSSIYIDDIAVEEINMPAGVTELNATPDENGALAVTVSWMNTTVSDTGLPINRLTKAELYKGTQLLQTFNDPIPGVKETYIDDSIEEPGKYQYKVITYIDQYISPETFIETEWVGPDTPNPVTELTCTISDDPSTVILSFKAPTNGINNGWINPDDLHYKIVRSPDEVILTDNLKETTLIDNEQKPFGTYRYTITAIADGKTSAETVSDPIEAGVNPDRISPDNRQSQLYYDTQKESLIVPTDGSIKRILIFNVAGTLIMGVEDVTDNVSLSKLPTGIYIIQAYDGKTIQQIKISKL